MAFYDANGVYCLDSPNGEAIDCRLSTLVECKIDRAFFVDVPNVGMAFVRLSVFSGNELKEYQLIDQNGVELRYPTVAMQEKLKKKKSEPLKLEAKLIATLPLPQEIVPSKFNGILFRSEKGYLVSRQWPNPQAFYVNLDGTCESAPNTERNVEEYGPELVPIGLFPLGFLVGVISIIGLASIGKGELSEEFVRAFSHPGWVWGTCAAIAVIGILVGMYFVYRFVRSRGLSVRKKRWWLLACIPLGIATPLAVVAIYPVLIREKCPKCGKLRRVDLDECEACGAGWEKPELQGIEILDRLPTRETATV